MRLGRKNQHDRIRFALTRAHPPTFPCGAAPALPLKFYCSCPDGEFRKGNKAKFFFYLCFFGWPAVLNANEKDIITDPYPVRPHKIGFCFMLAKTYIQFAS